MTVARSDSAAINTSSLDLAPEASFCLVMPDGKLHREGLLTLREKNDSQVGRKKGNERSRIQGSDIDTSRPEADGTQAKLDPSVCSKIVASVVKGAKGLEKSIARIHRWNIHAPLTAHRLSTNTSTTLTIETLTLFNKGSVSEKNPLEAGKFVVVIKNNVSLSLFNRMTVICS